MAKKKKKQKNERRSSEAGFKIFKDPELDWTFARTLQYMYDNAAEVGECLYIARRIDEKNRESWIEEWANLALKKEDKAKEALDKGHKISAKELFLCASNYYRTAEYATPPSHPRFHELWEKSVECFHMACPLFSPPIQIIEIPFKNFKLPGYFWRPDTSSANYPTLIAAGGNDTSLEEVFFLCGSATMRRGYNFFAFDHPGHRGAVHLYPSCTRRHDYEKPYKVAIDFLKSIPGVDDRIALTGFSYGGYVAARVAIHEDRIKAVIPNTPIVDMVKMQKSFGGNSRKRKFLLKIPPSFLNRLIERILGKMPIEYTLAKYVLWVFGMHQLSWSDVLKKDMYKMHIIKDQIHKITCPALAIVSDSEGEELLNQAQEFYEGISSNIKSIYVFNLEKDGSNDHIQLDNRISGNQIMFDWLDEIFKYNSQIAL
ncbi:MAG: alpha/beta hydrolase family protein [Candidatus Thorarchaeota archaeon]